jgi:hypothetical protein
VTEELSKLPLPLTAEEFIGIPGLLRQLNEEQIESVGQLPKELVILAKYDKVGIGTVEKLFDQLKSKAVRKEMADHEILPEKKSSYKKWESLYINVQLGDKKTIIRGESVPSIWKEALIWIEENCLPLH